MTSSYCQLYFTEFDLPYFFVSLVVILIFKHVMLTISLLLLLLTQPPFYFMNNSVKFIQFRLCQNSLQPTILQRRILQIYAWHQISRLSVPKEVVLEIDTLFWSIFLLNVLICNFTALNNNTWISSRVYLLYCRWYIE